MCSLLSSIACLCIMGLEHLCMFMYACAYYYMHKYICVCIYKDFMVCVMDIYLCICGNIYSYNSN